MKTDVGERRLQEMLGGYGHLISELNRLLDPGGINVGFPCFPGVGCLLPTVSCPGSDTGKVSLAGVN